MIRIVAAVFLLSCASVAASAQSAETTKPAARPDIPGIFTLELGFNRPLSGPENFSLGLWGSRTINLYYQYEFRILKSKMSFVPGIGLSLERYKFRNGDILGYADSKDTIRLYSPAQHEIPGLKKSQLITNYVEVPLELRFTSNPDDPARSFKASAGARVGFLYDAFTKIKYRTDGEVIQQKDKQNFNLNQLRYGVFGKIGFGNFSFFGYYNLSPLFKEGEGFYDSQRQPVDFNTFTVGISLASF